MNLKDYIRDIPDFPKEGIIFKDITPLWKDGKAFAVSIDEIAAKYEDKQIDLVVGIEARGFIVGAPVAYKLGVGFIPVRKPGKLPYKTTSMSYSLEYGTDTIEVHEDAISPDMRILIVDDLLATGGTAAAVIKLVEKLGGVVVGMEFLVDLTFLNGRDNLKGYNVSALMEY
ncbi:adenine phosphoribosyltransferase [Candidatus Desantisbacteria bacterium CG2_30_40_21]|uniref:Adenine phosphoribosyltransferase n=5 Tax=unclassified Candidatus Desantisiibacteriota TaxID=3106372 RepID=A0A2M7JEZ5_9BACT|nr:MAG: adenine phosphoribosyltransferase [Candidatus Desantisbacteria bacterium CG2_30_40_21]PIP41046.1 MAG: adenine phosphoribosyltransferase [Candidatus Desantisbacteria bacterium CG23_combo_of_CG06-09_8_20_14_all_40_23]PIX17956.1 MAG: adenine phosphoribosyltransferase [Candidatus Desantisbacteria bacterium CG_4_8_14_3_um_filter_40_12]PIY18814.1 MAG: adenine phosphoribosyltransferase [Candidatus Desantisbacteria bacterium CG_4_10_14_3_um_filter_40_18]PJB29277.1 MAG: adenine phosphoribosyltra